MAYVHGPIAIQITLDTPQQVQNIMYQHDKS